MDFFFHVWREFILNFFSFCGSVSRFVKGDPEPYFAVGWGIAKQRLRGLYPVRNFFWNYSLNFLSRDFVSAILNVCLDLNFFDLFATFVAVFFTLTNARVVL